jgi:cobalt-zinc-cadmium efflux system membrane fusion protein
MSMDMVRRTNWICFGLLIATLIVGCRDADSAREGLDEGGHGEAEEAKGPHGGRLLTSGDFQLELAIFEWGTAPEYRVWATSEGRTVSPEEIALEVSLTRLGGGVDRFSFLPKGDFLKSNEIVAEPHSFEVAVAVEFASKKHDWQFENFEGRTRIARQMAEDLGVETAVAGPVVLEDTINVYGRVRANPERTHVIRARYEGVVHAIHARIGDTVRKGEKILVIESDDSLNRYTIVAPLAGIITQRDANAGEHTGGRDLLTITDTSSNWVDLSIFPSDRPRVKVGNSVSIVPSMGGMTVDGEISFISRAADEHNQSVVARVVLDGVKGNLLPGAFVTAVVEVGERKVPLAVERIGLQSFRDFRVVYARVGDVYEVRMLELGHIGGEHAEVLEGIEPGTVYVTENSHLIKADIEKSGASHDH